MSLAQAADVDSQHLSLTRETATASCEHNVERSPETRNQAQDSLLGFFIFDATEFSMINFSPLLNLCSCLKRVLLLV